jgi:hypothetical protein
VHIVDAIIKPLPRPHEALAKLTTLLPLSTVYRGVAEAAALHGATLFRSRLFRFLSALLILPLTTAIDNNVIIFHEKLINVFNQSQIPTVAGISMRFRSCDRLLVQSTQIDW